MPSTVISRSSRARETPTSISLDVTTDWGVRRRLRRPELDTTIGSESGVGSGQIEPQRGDPTQPGVPNPRIAVVSRKPRSGAGNQPGVPNRGWQYLCFKTTS